MAHYGFNEVLPGLFIGSRFSVHSRLLNPHKITHLLSVDNFQEFPKGFITKSLDIDDDESQNISQYFNECIEFMAEHRVLVFCTAGRSRSASVVVAYLVKVKKMTVNQALALIRKVRRVQPNPGFMLQLFEWEKACCELCGIERRTKWFSENENWIVLRCEQCDLPMVVYRYHGLHVPDYISSQMQFALGKVADQEIGKTWYIDKVQRSIFGHVHWHARPSLFKL